MLSMHLLKLSAMPIFDQLCLEEALIRSDNRNWCILNEGSSEAIVMGISGKFHELLTPYYCQHHPLPLIKRFSGGGTVVVDNNTLFATFIANTKDFPQVSPFPEPIMRWTEAFYRPIFSPHQFKLKQNDYVINDKKCGGNAQYIKKDRWLHHSSFLWDYNEKNMQYLQIPKRQPEYRLNRSHTQFLTTLKNYFSSKKEWNKRFIEALHAQWNIVDISLEEALELKKIPHRQSTKLIVT